MEENRKMTKIESATLVQLTSSKLRIRHGFLYVFEQEMERDENSEFRLAIPFNGKCKSVSLTNEQRARIFIKCNAFRTNSNHNANCWMMVTVFIAFERNVERRTTHTAYTQTFSLFQAPCGILFDSHSHPKNHM